MIEKICMVLIFVGVAVGVGIYCRKHTSSVDGFVLGGRNVGMEKHYSEWMEAHVPENRAIAARLTGENELFYVLKRK